MNTSVGNTNFQGNNAEEKPNKKNKNTHMRQTLIHPHTEIFTKLYSAALSGILSNQKLIEAWTPYDFDLVVGARSSPQNVTESEAILSKRVIFFARHVALEAIMLIDDVNDDYFFADQDDQGGIQ